MRHISFIQPPGSLVFMLGLLNISRRVFSSMACSANQQFQGGVFSVSYVTAPSDEVAKKLADYEWEGEIQKDSEVLMVIKSRTSRLDDLTKYVRENHPYQVCEVISTPIQHGNEPYLKWLNDIVPEK
ncbi:protein CutA homolog [Trichonephila inaurata madagascariensis]|uniref:Protein CutA homolog n=1 Tax=Trichonephila inaurata madagascariensis TaxID=2747483 RepID=A0A8X7C2J5_9ARAC|nr:protein CutA homolog [Trichonephila inaurata madagascariensis]